MNATTCTVNPPGHDWQAGLSCRWCPATRTPEEAILSGLASVRGWSDEAAESVRDAYRAQVFNEAAAILQDRAAQYPTRRIFAAGLRHGALRLAKEAMRNRRGEGE